MAYDEAYYDDSYYDEYGEAGIGRNRLVVPVLSGCLGAIVGFACAACLALGAFVFLLPVSSTTSPPSSLQGVESRQPSAEPLFYTGSGKQTSPIFMLDPGLVVLKVTHDGSSTFVVALIDSQGNQVVDSSGGAPLINELGPFDGSVAVRIERRGEYLLDVTADGNWSVSIER
jgi:hypothetical protein